MKVLKKKGVKRLVITLLLTGILVYLATPIYKTLPKEVTENDIARIDIRNNASKENAVKILSKTNHSEPIWCKKKNGSCSVLKQKISSNWERFVVKFKVIGDGKLEITLRGPDKRDDKNIRYKVLVDYRSFVINKKLIFKDTISVWHDQPYRYSFMAKNGDIVEFSVKIRNHHPILNNVDLLMLLSVLILAFLLSYKLVQYIAKFKIIENNSRIDIVFVITFIILLFLPMSHISNDTKSMKENRMLAKHPIFFTKTGINNKFGTQFENWLNDRFLGRKQLLKIYTDVSQINDIVQNRFAIKAKNDMIFNINKLDFLSRPIPKEHLKNISKQLAKLQQWTDQHGILLYVMIPPSKEDIYRYELSNYFTKIDKKHSVIYPLKKYLEQHNNLSVIYPREMYLKSYNDYTYYKTDHHWTEFGAFLGYRALTNSIQKDFPEVKPLSENNFDTFYKELPRYGSFKNNFDRLFYKGSMCKLLNLGDNCPLSYKYKYFDHKNLKKLRVRMGPIPMSRITRYDEGVDKNVTLLGNSYGGFLMEFLPYNFKNVQMLRVNNGREDDDIYDMKRFEKHILNFKTDILIIYQQSDAVYKFEELYDK